MNVALSTQPTGPSSRPGRLRWPRYVAALILLTAAGVLAWWYRPVALTPPLPDDIQDTEVEHAIAVARQAVLDDPHSARVWGELGKVMLAQLFDREADICFTEAARLDPADPRWLDGRSVIALKRHPEKALPLLRDALLVAGEDWPQLRTVLNFRLADELMERGDLAEAEERFRAEWDRDPTSAHAALGLGLIAQARGDNRAAADLLLRARESRSARKYATAQLAALARARGDRAVADAYEKEIATLPSDEMWPDPFMDEVADLRVGQRAFERRIRRLEGDHQYAKAAQLYIERIKSQPKAEFYVGAGMNLARVRDYDRGWPLLREALRLEPDSANAHYSLGLTLFARAERDWQSSPASPQLLEWLREAVVHAKRAAAIRPGHAKSYMVWGLALKYLGQPDAAIAPLRMGLACQPSDPDLQLGLGQALLESGKGSEAEPYLENARRLAPHDPRPVATLERLRKNH